MVQFSRLLGGTVLLQLLVGCLAVGMLLLVRTEARHDELATCIALGASRGRLAYGIASEAALTTIGGLLLAVPCTVVLFGLLGSVRLPGGVALESFDLALDGTATLALALGSLVAGVIAAGFAMAFAFRASIGAGVRRGGSTQPYGRQPLRSTLVAIQVAVSLAALTGAALCEQYFEFMGMSLIDGRTFLSHELTEKAPVAVISASFARLIERNGSALWRRLPMATGRTDVAADGRLVVGVVTDVVERIQEPNPLTIFVPGPPAVGLSRSVVIRARGPVEAATREFTAAVRALDARVFPAPPATLDERIRRQMAPQQLALTVLASLSVLATLLTLIGNFLIAEASSLNRLREMGIRAALGATRSQLGGIVLAQTVRTVGLGLLAGLALAWLGAGTIQSFLFDVQPLDPATLAAVALSILLLSLAASLRAALRAARVDLLTVLKAE